MGLRKMGGWERMGLKYRADAREGTKGRKEGEKDLRLL